MNMKVKAAVARQVGGPLAIETIEIEAPRAHEVRVRVVATGVCHTDMVVRDGHLPTPFPVVLGHEGAGVVEAIGSAISKVAVGDHVVMSFNSCGGCPSCQDNEPAYCHEFFPRNFFATRADGSSGLAKAGEKIHGNFFGQSSFASYALCHERNVVKVRQDVALEMLGPLGCGVLTGAGWRYSCHQSAGGRRRGQDHGHHRQRRQFRPRYHGEHGGGTQCRAWPGAARHVRHSWRRTDGH